MRDRKSTRLNSSHLGTSYAVFCLKKKIQSGIKRVVYAEKYRLDDGIKLMQRAGIKVEYLNPDEKTSSVED